MTSKLLVLAITVIACASCKKADKPETLFSGSLQQISLVRVDVSPLPASIDVSDPPLQLCLFAVFSDSSVYVAVPQVPDSAQLRIRTYCSGEPLTKYRSSRAQ